ncbi:hypothetical protein B0H12DRAFT_327342 [Mycena haematopus]|nr:hypothetical protein B0H12DRAFT_327342 [Mycena haematopus]
MHSSGLQTPITTPAGERKVSFAPQVKVEPAQAPAKPPLGQMQTPPVPAADDTRDDSFGFFSDDDAFLASVDLVRAVLDNSSSLRRATALFLLGICYSARSSAPVSAATATTYRKASSLMIDMGRWASGALARCTPSSATAISAAAASASLQETEHQTRFQEGPLCPVGRTTETRRRLRRPRPPCALLRLRMIVGHRL